MTMPLSNQHAGESGEESETGDSAAAVAARAAARTRAVDQSRLTRILGYNVSRANSRLIQVFTQHIGPLQLKPVEFSALVLIASNLKINQRRLGEALDVSAPNLAVLLDRLAERGLLVRVRSDEDRRAQHLHLTEAGEELVSRAESIASSMEADALRMLSSAERALLAELLQKIARAPRRA